MLHSETYFGFNLSVYFRDFSTLICADLPYFFLIDRYLEFHSIIYHRLLNHFHITRLLLLIFKIYHFFAHIFPQNRFEVMGHVHLKFQKRLPIWPPKRLYLFIVPSAQQQSPFPHSFNNALYSQLSFLLNGWIENNAQVLSFPFLW